MLNSLFNLKNASKALGSVKKAKYAISMYPDLKAQTVHFFLMPLADTSAVSYESHPFRARSFDAAFFKELTEITTAYSDAHAESADSLITLILPDFFFATDTVSIPALNRKNMSSSLEVMLDSLYKNRADLLINTALSANLKKYSIYSVVTFNRNIRASFEAACSEGKMAPDCITFRSAAFTNAVSMIDAKYSASSYLMLDIRQNDSSFIFVSKGHATGFYSLPFGVKVLQRSSVAAENMLFDHDNAELMVLNAKEKARAKQLTMMKNDNPEGQTDADSETAIQDDPTAAAAQDAPVIKELPSKTARKVPSFMQRPTPKTPEEFAYENFLIFMKWALNLIQSNEKLVAIGAPETVLVNLPTDLSHVIETANGEQEENGISFTRFNIDETPETIRDHIELYGGLLAPSMNKLNNF